MLLESGTPQHTPSPSLPPQPNSRAHPASFISRKAAATMANDGDHGHSSSSAPTWAGAASCPPHRHRLCCHGTRGSRAAGQRHGCCAMHFSRVANKPNQKFVSVPAPCLMHICSHRIMDTPSKALERIHPPYENCTHRAPSAACGRI